MSAEVVDPATDAEPVEAPAAPAQADPAPNLIDRAKAAFKSRPNLQAEISQVKTERDDFRSQLSEAQSQVEALTLENETLKTQETELKEIIETAEADSKTATQTATELVASTGIPPEELPSQESADKSFEARFEEAQKEGPTALSKFMTDNKAEVNRALQSR